MYLENITIQITQAMNAFHLNLQVWWYMLVQWLHATSQEDDTQGHKEVKGYLMVILRVTSILKGQKKNNGMMCSITHYSFYFF